MMTLRQFSNKPDFLEYKPMYIGSVPVISASAEQKAPIIERVQKIFVNPDSPDVPRLEAEIDNLVYNLYALTPEEIAIVEGRANADSRKSAIPGIFSP